MKSGTIINYGDENEIINAIYMGNSFQIIPFANVFVTHEQVGADFTTKTFMSVGFLFQWSESVYITNPNFPSFEVFLFPYGNSLFYSIN